MGEIDLSRESPSVDIIVSAVQWPQRKRAPADSPPCGFDGELCVSTTTNSPTDNNASDVGGFESYCFFDSSTESSTLQQINVKLMEIVSKFQLTLKSGDGSLCL